MSRIFRRLCHKTLSASSTLVLSVLYYGVSSQAVFVIVLSQVFVFQHMYWVTLAVVYITVQSTISIFNFGFILWCFFFLWHGQALYLQPRTRLFKLWKIFIGYNYFTLLAKVCLQVRTVHWTYLLEYFRVLLRSIK